VYYITSLANLAEVTKVRLIEPAGLQDDRCVHRRRNLYTDDVYASPETCTLHGCHVQLHGRSLYFVDGRRVTMLYTAAVYTGTHTKVCTAAVSVVFA